MDKLDIFELDPKTKVITTVEELRSLYLTGVKDVIEDDDVDVLIMGEIV